MANGGASGGANAAAQHLKHGVYRRDYRRPIMLMSLSLTEVDSWRRALVSPLDPCLVLQLVRRVFGSYCTADCLYEHRILQKSLGPNLALCDKVGGV